MPLCKIAREARTFHVWSSETRSGRENIRICLQLFIDRDGPPHPFQRFEDEQGGKEITREFKTFDDFLARFSSFDSADIRQLFVDDNEICDLLDVANKRKHGQGRKMKIDNVNLQTPNGNSKAATLRRLRKDFPAIHARVLAGELSPNAAAIEAGFRRKLIQIPADDPARATALLKKHGYSSQDLEPYW